MTKFKLVASFAEPEELAQWQIDKKLIWGSTLSDLRKCTLCRYNHGISEKVKHLIECEIIKKKELIPATNGYKYRQHTGVTTQQRKTVHALDSIAS